MIYRHLKRQYGLKLRDIYSWPRGKMFTQRFAHYLTVRFYDSIVK